MKVVDLRPTPVKLALSLWSGNSRKGDLPSGTPGPFSPAGVYAQILKRVISRRVQRRPDPPSDRPFLVSVGNLALGGTGKTPVVGALARDLSDRGLRGAILTRGFGSTLPGPLVVTAANAKAGDEARWHAGCLEDSGWSVNRRSFLQATAVTTGLAVVGGGLTDKNATAGSLSCDDMLAHLKTVSSLVISPDGKILVSASFDKNIKLWSLPDGALLKTLTGHSYSVQSLAISPDGKLLASGSDDQTINLWSLPSGTLLKTLKGHSESILSLAISPDGKTLVSAGWDSTIKLWNLPSGTLRQTLEGHSSRVNSVSISPDGKMLASASGDKTIRLWSLPGGVLLKTLEGHASWVKSVAISPDSKIVVSGSDDKMIKLWSLPSGVLLKTWQGHSHMVRSLAISPDGEMLVSGSGYRKIKLWSLPNGESLNCLIDLEICTDKVEGITYKRRDSSREIQSYTLPSGSPIPAGAVCTCNTVSGSVCSCVSHRSCSCVSHTGSHYWHSVRN